MKAQNSDIMVKSVKSKLIVCCFFFTNKQVFHIINSTFNNFKVSSKKKHIKKTELHIIYIELWIYINKVTVHSVSMQKKKCKYIEI